MLRTSLIAVAIAAAACAPAAAQTLFERNKAVHDCQRKVARAVGPPPRTESRPGDDLVEMARRRQDWEDRYSRMMSDCVVDTEIRIRKRDPN